MNKHKRNIHEKQRQHMVNTWHGLFFLLEGWRNVLPFSWNAHSSSRNCLSSSRNGLSSSRNARSTTGVVKRMIFNLLSHWIKRVKENSVYNSFLFQTPTKWNEATELLILTDFTLIANVFTIRSATYAVNHFSVENRCENTIIAILMLSAWNARRMAANLCISGIMDWKSTSIDSIPVITISCPAKNNSMTTFLF